MLDFKKKSMRNKFLIWSGVLLIWMGIVVGTLWSKGYQHQSSRSFTDQEMIRIAVQRSIQRMQVDPPFAVVVPQENGSRREYFRPAIIVPYHDVDHFLKENQECCMLKKDGRSITVYVHGKLFYKNKSGQIRSSEAIRLGWQDFPDNIRYLP